jgi:hypothetical protein
MLVLLPAEGLGEAGSGRRVDEVLAPKEPLKELPKEPGAPKDDLLWPAPLTLWSRGLPMGENWETEPLKL